MPSIFTRIINGEIPSYKVQEDDKHLAFLDINPLVEGHVLVIPKREVDEFFDLEGEELAELIRFAQKVAAGIKTAIPCNRVAVSVIGLEVPHAHVHLIPINKMSDCNFANEKLKLGAERMQTIANKIREAIG